MHSVGVRLSLDEQSLRAQLEDLEAEDVLVSSTRETGHALSRIRPYQLVPLSSPPS